MTATSTAPLHPVQLILDLRATTVRRRTCDERRPFWEYIDLADLGGDLRARRPGVRALITAEQRGGAWIGTHDLVLGQTGSSASTRPQPTRQDALASAAHGLAQPCWAIVDRPRCHAASTVAAGRQLLRWLSQLDLL